MTINFNVVAGEVHHGLHAVVLGGEDKKLGLGSYKLDLELLAVQISQMEEEFQLFEVRADMPNMYRQRGRSSQDQLKYLLTKVNKTLYKVVTTFCLQHPKAAHALRSDQN